MKLFKNEIMLALVVFFLSFLTYFLTLCPAVFTGDSGELIAAAYTLGVPHSPGYPLYCLIGKLFTFIPLGSIAFRVNLMSAFFASLCTVALFFILLKILSRINPQAQPVALYLPSAAASLIYAYSSTFWSQAVVAEVYTLWIFVLLLSLFTLILWTQDNRKWLLYMFSFLYGIAITSHQLSLFFAPGFIFLIVAYQPNVFSRGGSGPGMVLAFLTGLCLYLYIPLSAAADPVMNWNKIHDIRSFVDYLLRRQYGPLRQNFSPRHLTGVFSLDVDKIKQLFEFLKDEFSAIYLFSILGFIPFFLKAKRYLVFFLVCVTFSFMGILRNIDFSPQGIYIGRVYLLGCLAIVAIFLGAGLSWLIHFYGQKRKKILYHSMVVMISSLPLAPLGLNYHKNDQSKNFIAYDFGMNILHTLEKDAILLAHGDTTLFVLAYLQLVEKTRPDVTIYDDIGGDVFKGTFSDSLVFDKDTYAVFVEDLLKKMKRPVYVTFGHTLVINQSAPKELVGIVYKLLRDKETVALKEKEKYWRDYKLNDIFYGYLENKDFLMREIIFQYHMALGTYIFPKNNALGLALYRKAQEISPNAKFAQEILAVNYSLIGMHTQAIEIFKKIAKNEPQDSEVYYNLGVAYAKARRYAEAISSWEAALKLNPKGNKVKHYIAKAQVYLREEKEKK